MGAWPATRAHARERVRLSACKRHSATAAEALVDEPTLACRQQLRTTWSH